jgi:hypothetical protein
MVKKAVRLDDSLQLGNRLEEFEGAENQAMVAAVIREGLLQADPPETPGP